MGGKWLWGGNGYGGEMTKGKNFMGGNGKNGMGGNGYGGEMTRHQINIMSDTIPVSINYFYLPAAF